MNINLKIRSAIEHFQAGNLKLAESLCEEVLQEQPGNFLILDFLGIINYHSGNYDLAVPYFRKALQINPYSSETVYNLGNALIKRGELDEAVTCFQKVLALNANNFDAYSNLGFIFMKMKRIDEAIIYFKKAVQIQPDNAHAYYNLGSAYQMKFQFDDAILCYQKALQLKRDLFDAYINLGLTLYDKKELDNALFYLQKALEINPKKAEAYCSLGMIFKEKGQYDEAINFFQKALQLKPDYAWACTNLAAVLEHSGKLEEAKTYFQKALQLNLNMQSSLSNFGDILQEEGQPVEVKFSKTNQGSILICIPVFNRKKITELSLVLTKKYKTSNCYLQVYNDHSTEYNNSFLQPYADEVIQLPDKMGIHNLRFYQFRQFLKTDFDFLYLTDNDVIHDPQFISMLGKLHKISNKNLPVSLYNNIFTMQPGMILYCKKGILLRSTVPGNSMFFNREMVKKIVESLDKDNKTLDYLPWDNKVAIYLDLPWISSEISYLEHYGAHGINNDNYERDRAINPTKYLRDKRATILDYLMKDTCTLDQLLKDL